MYSSVGKIALFFGICFLCTSANRHLGTTMDQNTQEFTLQLPEEKLVVNLDSEGTIIAKYPDQKLKELHFTLGLKRYSVYFWPKWHNGKEQIAKLQQFEQSGKQFVPDGKWFSFSSTGILLSESSWRLGKLHGKQKLYNDLGIALSEKAYDQGYPVGVWTVWYVEGTPAERITYPESAEEWKKTRAFCGPSCQRQRMLGKRLLGLANREVITAKQEWFFPSGQKNKEKVYRLYVDSQGAFQQYPTGNETTWWENGKIRSRSSVLAGSGTKTSFPESVDQGQIPYQTQEKWHAGSLYRRVTRSIDTNKRK